MKRLPYYHDASTPNPSLQGPNIFAVAACVVMGMGIPPSWGIVRELGLQLDQSDYHSTFLPIFILSLTSHSLVPIVPKMLLDYVQLPSTYIMGIHSSLREEVDELVRHRAMLSS